MCVSLRLYREVLNLSSWCLELLHPSVVFKGDQLLEAELDPWFDDQELALGLQTRNIREVFDEFREVFDPDLDDTLVQDSINQVDEVLSDGNNSPIDRQAGKQSFFFKRKLSRRGGKWRWPWSSFCRIAGSKDAPTKQTNSWNPGVGENIDQKSTESDPR